MRAILLCLAASACATGGGATALTGPGVPADADLMFELHVEVGNKGFAHGDGFTITRVLGDRPRIEANGWYHVQGTWKLASRDEAQIEVRCANGRVVGDTRRYVRKGAGTFAVTFRLAEDGFLHLSLYSVDGVSVGGAYFGQGEGIYRGTHVPGS